MAVNATNRIYSIMKQRILNGEYSPSEALIESELANEFEVSRNTIKKALLMLENEYLVVTEPNRSAKVRSYSLNEVLEFLEVRTILESYIAKITTPVMSEDAITELETFLAQMGDRKKEQDLIGYSTLNQQFHERIYKSCPNHTLISTTQQLKSQMRKYNSKTILIPHRDEASFEEHTKICHAIKTRNADAAEKYMAAHIQNVRKIFQDYYHILF